MPIQKKMKHRYSITWTANKGHGSSVIEADQRLSDEEIKRLINEKLPHGHKVILISKRKISTITSIVFQLLIAAANVFSRR